MKARRGTKLSDEQEEVSFQWKDPDFLSRNPDLLLKNVEFRRLLRPGGGW